MLRVTCHSIIADAGDASDATTNLAGGRHFHSAHFYFLMTWFVGGLLLQPVC
jgi:hypothetical protein